MYSPALGRFMQADPIGYQGGINLYAYVGNDPLNLIDPLGLSSQPSGSSSGSSWSLTQSFSAGFNTATSPLDVSAFDVISNGNAANIASAAAGYLTGVTYSYAAEFAAILLPLKGAAAVRPAVKVYRQGTFADEATGWPGNQVKGQQWAAENPLTTPKYVERYGLPAENSGKPDWVVQGQVQGQSSARPAPGSHNNPGNTGGATEIIPSNPSDVRLNWFHMPD